jgi:hypothetical protein
MSGEAEVSESQHVASNGASSAAVEPAPARISEEDRLRVEVAHLNVLNCGLQEELIKAQLELSRMSREKHTQRLLALRVELSGKYGIDFKQIPLKQNGEIG